ncbi:MAG: NTP pyrophosphohydrolase [Micromonosporaceae bacterium]|nr:NTP pyrophosphohydrolase [Micromonosporaceae bacterium]
MPDLLIVDAANVVGSVPDGWWRDRPGAAGRLRDALAGVAASGLPDADPAVRPPLEVVLVVEGVARDVAGTDEVRVVAAPGSGDDAIVDLVRREGGGRRCVVVTADRALRERVERLGASVLGPRAVRRR